MIGDELHGLLDKLGREPFIFHQFHVDRDGPDVIYAVRDWGVGLADVVALLSEKHGCAYRVMTGPGVDVFAPELVLWWYAAPVVWTLRAVLTLPPPGHPEAPNQTLTPPPDHLLPSDSRTPVRVTLRRRYSPTPE